MVYVCNNSYENYCHYHVENGCYTERPEMTTCRGAQHQKAVSYTLFHKVVIFPTVDMMQAFLLGGLSHRDPQDQLVRVLILKMKTLKLGEVK